MTRKAKQFIFDMLHRAFACIHWLFENDSPECVLCPTCYEPVAVDCGDVYCPRCGRLVMRRLMEGE